MAGGALVLPPNLQDLRVGPASVDEWLMQDGSRKALSKLTSFAPSISSPKCLPLLAELGSLQRLALCFRSASGAGMFVTGMERLSTLTNVTHLHVSADLMQQDFPAVVIALSQLTQLRELQMGGVSSRPHFGEWSVPDIVSLVVALPHLERLVLRWRLSGLSQQCHDMSKVR